MKEVFRRKVLTQYHGYDHIIEASTDFDLDIGFNSLICLPMGFWTMFMALSLVAREQ